MLLQEIYRALITSVSSSVKKTKKNAKKQQHCCCDADNNDELIDFTRFYYIADFIFASC